MSGMTPRDDCTQAATDGTQVDHPSLPLVAGVAMGTDFIGPAAPTIMLRLTAAVCHSLCFPLTVPPCRAIWGIVARGENGGHQAMAASSSATSGIAKPGWGGAALPM